MASHAHVGSAYVLVLPGGVCYRQGKRAQCLYCDDTINYGSRGCLALVEHATKGKKHAGKAALRRTNYSLGSAFVIEIPTTSSAGFNAGELTEHITRPPLTCQPLTALALHNGRIRLGKFRHIRSC